MVIPFEYNVVVKWRLLQEIARSCLPGLGKIPADVVDHVDRELRAVRTFDCRAPGLANPYPPEGEDVNKLVKERTPIVVLSVQGLLRQMFIQVPLRVCQLLSQPEYNDLITGQAECGISPDHPGVGLIDHAVGDRACVVVIHSIKELDEIGQEPAVPGGEVVDFDEDDVAGLEGHFPFLFTFSLSAVRFFII